MSGLEPSRDPLPEPDLGEVRAWVPEKSTLTDLLRAWWPAVLWAAVIFHASTDTFSSGKTHEILGPILRWLYPAITNDQLDAVNFLVRKCAHVIEYFVFYLLIYRGLSRRRRVWRWSWGLGAWLIASAYSVSDELHQSFVASRVASPWDSLLDSTAALAALVVLFLLFRFNRPRRTS